MNIVAKSSQPTNVLAANELVKDPSGALRCGNGLEVPYPKFIRNGYFNSGMNTWTNPLSAADNMVFDGWFVKKNGTPVINAARGEPRGTGGWNSRYHAIVTIDSNPTPAASDFAILEQRTYDCSQYADKILTYDFEADASITGTVIGAEFVFDEANGTQLTIAAGTITLDTKVKTYTVQAAMPKLSGAGLGSLHNMKLRLWLYAGNNYTPRFGSKVNNVPVSIRIGSVRDRSLSYEPSAREEMLQVAQYYFTSAATQFMAAAGTSAFSATSIANINFPTPLAYIPSASNLTVTTSFLASPTVTPTQFGASVSGVPNNATSAARITAYTLNIELPQ